MAKVSVIIPSRNERYLIPTIEDVFRNAQGEIDVIAVLDGGDWPTGWKELSDKHQNLHTIRHSESKGMRPAINAAAASAIHRGAKYLMKLDAHCMVGEGFDEILKADCDQDWVVIPRRKRLDPETWTLKDVGKPDIDYHYLSFPDDPKDFGGPGLNGKVWDQRIRERLNDPQYDIDDEMASQGSGWFMHSAYFTELELMDDKNYGPFWNESQEILNKCWLSGGRGVINKKTFYAHWHKGKAGRGYHLNENWLKQGATFTKKWLFNEAWAKQTLPFKYIIERFWPVPTWPENWEELVYGGKDIPSVFSINRIDAGIIHTDSDTGVSDLPEVITGLTIHSARYGVWNNDQFHPEPIDVTAHVQSLVKDNTLDLNVNNSTLTPDENPFRGKKKRLLVRYSYNGGEIVDIARDEKDWLIIGGSKGEQRVGKVFDEVYALASLSANPVSILSPTALNDLLIRRFQIPSHRLRGPMPIEIPTFHRNDLAKLFAELGFNKGAEVGVAEGNYSEVLVKANPNLELLCVDPWHAYSGNPQNKTKEKNEYAYNEAKGKLKGYNVRLDMRLSMDAVRDVADGSLDWVYIDAHHSYPFVMSDLIFWSQKVRSGGIVAGDDVYKLNDKWGSGPMEAIYHYTEAMKINPWFLIAAHRSVDFFFVKE